MSEEVVILEAKRTPIGAFQGNLSALKAPELGSIAIQGALEEAGVSPFQIDEVLMGCVLTAGLGQAPARQAARGANIPSSVPCTTLNKICGSGMKAVSIAANEIRTHNANIVIAGGMESMSNAPYLLDKARKGYHIGHGRLLDHLILDGLEDAYDHRLMGQLAEQMAKVYNFTREAQDKFAISSILKALHATQEGLFTAEINPVHREGEKETIHVIQDESPFRGKIERVSSLDPSFEKGGTITAANSSPISDGAAALVLSSRTYCEKLALRPRAVIRGFIAHAQEPKWFTTAPIKATQKLLEKVNWKIEDVDLFEINEAFAVVAMAAIKDLNLPPEKVNVNGGACALGHPIGASGARLLATLLNSLENRKLKRGIATLCIGGGEAMAMAIERI